MISRAERSVFARWWWTVDHWAVKDRTKDQAARPLELRWQDPSASALHLELAGEEGGLSSTASSAKTHTPVSLGPAADRPNGVP